MAMSKAKTGVLAGALVLVAGGVVIGAVDYLLVNRPPPMPQDLDEATEVLHSRAFARLPDDRKLVYGERVRELMESADDEQRQAFVERVELNDAVHDMRAAMMVRWARQFAQAPPEQREAILDGFVQKMQAGKGPGPGGRPDAELTGEQRAKRDARRREGIDKMREMAATGNPQDAAYIQEFFKALSDRME